MYEVTKKCADTDYKFDPDYHISCGLILINTGCLTLKCSFLNGSEG